MDPQNKALEHLYCNFVNRWSTALYPLQLAEERKAGEHLRGRASVQGLRVRITMGARQGGLVMAVAGVALAAVVGARSFVRGLMGARRAPLPRTYTIAKLALANEESLIRELTIPRSCRPELIRIIFHCEVI